MVLLMGAAAKLYEACASGNASRTARITKRCLFHCTLTTTDDHDKVGI